MTLKLLEVDQLKEEIRNLILNELDLDLDPKALQYDTPLFGVESPIGLDSAVFSELMVAIEQKYEMIFEDDAVASRNIFDSISSLAVYSYERIRVAREEGLSHIVLAAPVVSQPSLAHADASSLSPEPASGPRPA